jgi:hypothetical protein
LGTPTPLFSVIVALFYVSETIMIVGICISIRHSIVTATKNNVGGYVQDTKMDEDELMDRRKSIGIQDDESFISEEDISTVQDDT